MYLLSRVKKLLHDDRYWDSFIKQKSDFYVTRSPLTRESILTWIMTLDGPSAR